VLRHISVREEGFWLFLNLIVHLLLVCLYMSVIPIKYVLVREVVLIRLLKY